MAVKGKISTIDSKIAEFGEIEDKNDDHHMAITHLNSVKTHLHHVSALLNGSTIKMRNDESRNKRFSQRKFLKNFHRLQEMDPFDRKVSGHAVTCLSYKGTP